MSKKIVAVNAGPRKGWNTDILVTEAANGAAAAGAEVEYFDLFSLERFTGCISCFGCKLGSNQGRCVYQDGLSPVLEAIREADGLIIGTPNYLGNATSSFRALFERLIFQYITYNREKPSYNERKIPILLIMTSNREEGGYQQLLSEYQGMFSLLGPADVISCGSTLQVSDYSRFNWTNFNHEERIKRRETVFPGERKNAFEKGAKLVTG